MAFVLKKTLMRSPTPKQCQAKQKQQGKGPENAVHIVLEFQGVNINENGPPICAEKYILRLDVGVREMHRRTKRGNRFAVHGIQNLKKALSCARIKEQK